MACLQYGLKIPYLWGYAVAGGMSCLLAQSHVTQKGNGLNFSQQQLRAHQRYRPGFHTTKGFTTWEKESKHGSSALLFCFGGGGGAFSRDNEVGQELVFSTVSIILPIVAAYKRSLRFASKLVRLSFPLLIA